MDANPMLDIYREQNRVLEIRIHRLMQEIDDANRQNAQYTRLLAIAVQRLGGQMVIVDDEMPCLLINGNVVSTRPVVRVYPVVQGVKDLGMGDE